MEGHRCKLCLKSFSNGRALGGHMRSHMMNLTIPPKPEAAVEDEDHIQVSEETEPASSSSSSEEEAEADFGDEKEGSYGLRENPKRSIRLVDPEFSFAVEAANSVVLQDRESETESSKNPTRRRSKRTRKLLEHQYILQQQQQQRQEQENNIKKLKLDIFSKPKTESWTEPEQPASSISDTTTEEDVAFCLMMLSRDKWKRKEQYTQQDQDHEDEYEDDEEKSVEETDESDEFKSSKARSRGKYKCETCNKVFKSYQALGGHRASHRKLKLYTPNQETEQQPENAVTSTSISGKKIHECPYCFRVFSSGQALGGHKRSHVTGVAATPARSTTKLQDNLNLIDLNLPAPIDEDDVSQIELSAVSDAEFVNHIKR